MDKAWEAQSESLKDVQIKGGKLEKEIKKILNWDHGRVIYDKIHNYNLQVDNIFPNKTNPEIFASVTYTEPDTKGHSNENKLQLKVGELVLLKNEYPECKVILVLGGSPESWLPYVLDAFEFFFDEVISIWDDNGINRLLEIKKNPDIVIKKHNDFWNELRREMKEISFLPTSFTPPNCLFRYKILDRIKAQNPPVNHPDLINNRVAGLCMQRAKSKGGKEWDNFLKRNWQALEQSRSYFNPLESLVEIILTDAKLAFEGGIAHDIPVPSFLHQLGMENTLLSEDFILYSTKYNMPVYIQCKASGGGRNQHGKNIQNRTKEQLTRGLLYRCNLQNNDIVLSEKKYIWISILDGNWGVTQKSPLKYLHMLQMAGYNKFFASEDLVDNNLNPIDTKNNDLSLFLINDLKCKKKI